MDIVVLTANVIVNIDGVHHHAMIDAIDYEGQIWLVPEWIEVRSTKAQRPLRIIGLAKVRHRRQGPLRVLVEDPIPKSVLDGLPQPADSDYTVRDFPPIEFPIDDFRH